MEEHVLWKYIVGDATKEEKDLAIEWINKDKANQETYLSFRRLYNISLLQEDVCLSKKRDTSIKKYLIYAVKIAAFFIFGFFTVEYFHVKYFDKDDVIMQKLYVPAGQRAQITLADNTEVWLNAKTTFIFPNKFSETYREVELDGEGYFDVSKNKKIPFIVKTKKYNIQVLGTEFNVKAYSKDENFETALLKGMVKVENNNSKSFIILNPLTQVIEKDGSLIKSSFTEQEYFKWRDGLICFEDIDLTELFNKIELYFDIKIIVKNKKILNERYSGKFRFSDGVEHILETLQLKTKFKYEKKDVLENTIIIN